MKNENFIIAMLVLCLVAFTPVFLHAQDEPVEADNAAFPDGARLIPALTVPNIVIDFDKLPKGPTTVENINAAYPGSTLSQIIIDPNIGSTDFYDFNEDGGRALAPNPDDSGNLFIVDPGDAIGVADSWTIVLNAPTNEFGILIGDQAEDFKFDFFLGDEQVATIFADVDAPPVFLQTNKPFNSIVISDAGGWVAGTLYLATGTPSRPIPTLSEWGLIAMAGLLGIVGFIAVRKKYAVA